MNNYFNILNWLSYLSNDLLIKELHTIHSYRRHARAFCAKYPNTKEQCLAARATRH